MWTIKQSYLNILRTHPAQYIAPFEFMKLNRITASIHSSRVAIEIVDLTRIILR